MWSWIILIAFVIVIVIVMNKVTESFTSDIGFKFDGEIVYPPSTSENDENVVQSIAMRAPSNHVLPFGSIQTEPHNLADLTID